MLLKMFSWLAIIHSKIPKQLPNFLTVHMQHETILILAETWFQLLRQRKSKLMQVLLKYKAFLQISYLLVTVLILQKLEMV